MMKKLRKKPSLPMSVKEMMMMMMMMMGTPPVMTEVTMIMKQKSDPFFGA